MNTRSYPSVLPINAAKYFNQFFYKRKLTILLSRSTVVEHLLFEDVTNGHGFGHYNYRATYLKKEPHFLTDQPRTCCIFMLRSIKYIFFLTNLVTSLVYRFYLNRRSYSKINSVCSSKWALYQPRH